MFDSVKYMSKTTCTRHHLTRSIRTAIRLGLGSDRDSLPNRMRSCFPVVTVHEHSAGGEAAPLMREKTSFSMAASGTLSIRMSHRSAA